MRRYQIDAIEETSAQPATVYALLRDGSTWPSWSEIDSFAPDREGDGEPEGVGAVRVFRNGRIVGRDLCPVQEGSSHFSLAQPPAGGVVGKPKYAQYESFPPPGQRTPASTDKRNNLPGQGTITELEPERRFSYLHLAGLPVRDYRGQVSLQPADGGTKIHWRVSFSAKVPGTGWLLHRGLTRFIKRTTHGLAAYAANQ